MKAHEVLKETGMIHEGPHDPYYRKKVGGILTKFRKRDNFNEGPEQFIYVTGRQWLSWKETNKDGEICRECKRLTTVINRETGLCCLCGESDEIEIEIVRGSAS